MKNGVVIPMYHYVRDVAATDFPEIKALSITDFQRQLDWLQEQFTILRYEELMECLKERKNPSKPAALLTFDDGFVDHYETVFPIFRERGISGVFFVSDSTIGPTPALLNVHKTHFLLARLGADAFARAVEEELDLLRRDPDLDTRSREGIYPFDAAEDKDVKKLLNYELPFEVADGLLLRLFRKHLGDDTEFARSLYLSEEMIREMAEGGMTFGPHTRDHRVLSRLDGKEQWEQLKGGADLIRSLTGQTSVPFCYPYGYPHTYTEETIAILQETGHDCAFTTIKKSSDLTEDPPFELPRFDTKDLPPFTEEERFLVEIA